MNKIKLIVRKIFHSFLNKFPQENTVQRVGVLLFFISLISSIFIGTVIALSLIEVSSGISKGVEVRNEGYGPYINCIRDRFYINKEGQVSKPLRSPWDVLDSLQRSGLKVDRNLALQDVRSYYEFALNRLERENKIEIRDFYTKTKIGRETLAVLIKESEYRWGRFKNMDYPYLSMICAYQERDQYIVEAFWMRPLINISVVWYKLFITFAVSLVLSLCLTFGYRYAVLPFKLFDKLVSWLKEGK